MTVTIRPLTPYDWAEFRDIRLLALRAEPRAFAVPYEAWATKPPKAWRDLIAGPGHQAFGLFDDSSLIGITGVVTDREDASGQTALLIMSFILPAYRRRGLSQLLYAARLEWIRQRGNFTKVRISYRASNEPSRRANQRHGFRAVRREATKWPDGVMEDEVFCELAIVRSAAD